MSTLKDVAKMAGVSTSTASRALSGKSFVEASTKERVLHAAEALNYSPAIVAKSLKKLNTLAFLVPEIVNLFYPMIIHEVERIASDRGHLLIINNSENSSAKEAQLLQVLRSGITSGILCMSASDDVLSLAEYQKESDIPVVLINRPSRGLLSSVSLDDEYGGYLMTKYLLDHGHRKIAGFFGDFNMERFRARYNGAKKAMEEYGVDGYKKYFIYDVTTVTEASQRTYELLTSPDPPTAFFASVDIVTMGIYSGISRCGLQIPDDISVVGFDNIFITEFMIPPLTTYDFPVKLIAEKAVDLLLNQINGNPDITEELLQGTLIERGSVKSILPQSN